MIMQMDLPQTWKKVRVSDIGTIITGNTPPKINKSNFGSHVPFVKPPELLNDIIQDVSDYLSKEGAAKARVIPPNSVLVSCIGNLGKTGINSFPVAFNQQINAIVPFNGINPLFIFYQAQSFFFRKQLEEFSSATTISIINKGNFQQLFLNLAPRNEQNRIVAKIEELFSEIDKGLENLQKAQELLNLYRQTLLKNAFEGKLTEKWREINGCRLKTAKELYAYVNEEYKNHICLEFKNKSRKKSEAEIVLPSQEELAFLPSLPSNYLYVRLSYLGELGRGKSKHRPRNDPILFGGPYPFIQTGEVKAANRVITKYHQTYSANGLEQSKLWPKGTLCITISANIAETAFLGFDCCFPDSIVGFKAISKIIIPEYVELFIKSIRKQIEAYAPATAQKNINLTTLENLIIPLCSLDEQREIVNVIGYHFSTIDKLEKEIEENLIRNESLRQNILKRAFSGELLNQNSDDEPASSLIERINTDNTNPKKHQSKTRKTKKALP